MRRDRNVPFLEGLCGKGTRAEFYDPAGERFGTPTFPYHYAPDELATRRQLRAAGLRPGGQEVQAQIIWRHRSGRRVAYLYDKRLALPKREATPAQREAIAKALLARKTCQSCQTVYDYCIPTSLGECVSCHEGTRRGPAREEELEAG
jgi:hypothetical protein